jgi:hypothetical protein
MPRFDLPGRTGPVTITLGRDHHELDMSLPYTTDDAREIKRLLEAGCVEVKRTTSVAPPAKPSKEVTE